MQQENYLHNYTKKFMSMVNLGFGMSNLKFGAVDQKLTKV